MKKNLRRGVAAICSLAMLASVLSCGMTVNALDQETPKESYDRQLLGETDFDYKILPWHTVEAAPAKQNFEITSDGELHVMILSATGADKEKWDLQVRHRNLSFRAGKTYEIEVKVKAKRAGMQLTSQISTVSGDEYYCVLDEDKFMNGPYMGGKWGSCARLTTEYQTIKGEFTPTRDIDGAEWNFQYARGTMYEGNAQEGDELWFDYMSIIEKDSTGDPYYSDYGYTTRKFSGLENNYISVNQVGYFPNGKKVAVLGDNGGDITPDEINPSEYKNDKISLTAPVEFEVIDAGSGKSVFKGLSSAPSRDADSGDTVCKLDFSEFTTPGYYYIKAGDWRSFDFSISGDIYSEKGHGLLTNAVNYFYQNRSADDIEEKYITSGNKAELAHKGEHNTDTAAVQKIWKKEYLSREEAAVTYKSSSITANGGWYESASHRKNMVSGGMALWTLQNMYERASIEGNAKFDEGTGTVIVPENNNKIPDILDETAFELEWMEQMKVAEDEPTWGESAAGLFYHEISDQRWAGIALKPWDYIDEYDNIVRIAKPPTFAATLNYAACAAQAARLWAPYDSAKAERYLDKAMDAYNAYLQNYYEADMTITTHPYYAFNECAKEELNESSLYASDWQSVTGPYSAYGDDYVDDDAYWAACEIFVSASEMKNENAEKFKKELEKFKDAYKISSKISGGENDNTFTSFNWGNTAAAGTMTLALHKDLLEEKNVKKITDSVTKAAEEYLETEENQGYGIPYKNDENPYTIPLSGLDDIRVYGYEFGSNGMVLNNAIIMAYAYDLTGDSKYSDGVTGAMDYLLGTNPMSFSFVSGYGSYAMDNPNHRYWAYEFDHSFPKTPDGVISGGPTAYIADPYARALGFVPGKAGTPSQRCYVDSVESYSTNETSLDWNASLAWVASFLEDRYSGDSVIKPKESPKPTASPEPTENVSPEPAKTAAPTATSTPTVSPTKTSAPTAASTPTTSPTEKSSPLTSPTLVPTNGPKVPVTDVPGEDPIATETSDKYLDDPYIPGDVDCNGKVDLTDLTTLAIALVDNEPLFNMMGNNADVTGDGKVDLADLATFRQYLSKKITEFPVNANDKK